MLLFLTLVYLACSAQARVSVMYAHERSTDVVAEECLNEMFPKAKFTNLQETDEPCIIFCVLKKFGIMNSRGSFDLEQYTKHVQTAHYMARKLEISNYGNTCMQAAESAIHKQDVCSKAKIFNDCTHLYKILLRK